jgi:phosphohistidine phosphatase
MQILLIRHADAGDRDPAAWPDDRHRPMSAKGGKRHRRAVKRLRRAELVPTLLLASPWTRAWQTAELTAALLGAPPPVACPPLADTPDLGALAAAVGDQPPEAIVALVGHEPWLGELAALLLTGDSAGVTIDFPKSGILGLASDHFRAGSAALEFFWRPK